MVAPSLLGHEMTSIGAFGHEAVCAPRSLNFVGCIVLTGAA